MYVHSASKISTMAWRGSRKDLGLTNRWKWINNWEWHGEVSLRMHDGHVSEKNGQLGVAFSDELH